MVAAWTQPERHLIAELAVGIARRLEAILGKTGDSHPVGPGYVNHGAQSAFEIGCDVLWRLGVAHGTERPEPRRSKRTRQTIVDENVFPTFFRFLPPSEIRALLAGDPPPASLIRQTRRPVPSLHETLCAYVGVACSYGSLSSRRERFTPQQEYVREIDALVRLGYIERRGTAVIWTDKIALAMYENHMWPADGPTRRPRPIR